MAALVILRLSLGCHFLYEGIWKIEHRGEFSAEPFLSQAKGPIANFFYSMIPDQNGRQRLTVETAKTDKGQTYERVDPGLIAARWTEIQLNLANYLKPNPVASEKLKSEYEKFKIDSEESLKNSIASLKEYLSSPEVVESIKGYFGSLDRFEQNPENNQDAPFQKERRWNRMMELRSEAKVWINEIEDRERAFLHALRDQMPEEYRERITALPGSWMPWRWSQMQLINFAVTYGLTAIGICLVLGLCTRLAALGGAAFMCFVVMTQPAWPGIYPADLPQLGHALIINKDFIEMVSLVVIATTAVGRWGGLDFFLYRLFVRASRSRVPSGT